MLQIIDYANLSKDIYGMPFKIKTMTIPELTRRGSGVADDFYRFTDVDPRMHTDNNFFAQLYIKFCNGKAKAAMVINNNEGNSK
jgi:hypothetical protein